MKTNVNSNKFKKSRRMLNVKCQSDYSVQNDESLRGHCTDERRNRDKKFEKKCDLRRQQRIERE